ncbi:MAG: hypothetical protein JSR82_09895 [Verrucomicrobia bacterium]|nr:hypothetical protein [Verrucomicrobiota bacterium]
MLLLRLLRTALAVLLLSASPPAASAGEPFYPGLGSHRRPISTASPLAQRYFDQGVALLHGFNHAAAIRSFQAAAQADPSCAMAHWGIALAAGPHINFPLVPPPMAELAWKHLTLAQQHASKAQPAERALLEALAKRYVQPPQPEDRTALDRAYADAMREVWKRFPRDADVGVLFAEAMMDLSPWNQWTLDGQANPGTEEILATLEAVLRLNPDHPLANHLYIHAVEASPHPERADRAAARLRRLQPGLAHNVHMPSHIDIRRGRWQLAIETNARAIEADRNYRRSLRGRDPGLFPVYAAHNQHMLAYAAMMTGQSRVALLNVRQLLRDLPPGFVQQSAPLLEYVHALPLEIMVRFGQWDRILAEPERYADYMYFSRAFHQAARAIAFAAKGQPEEARRAQALFRERSALVPKETMISNNPGATILELTTRMLEGEILVAEGKIEEALQELAAALKIEDALRYDEPPGWMIPLRHVIGATLMKAGRFAEAEAVYRGDLRRMPNNGWSLYGLAASLRAQSKAPREIAAADLKFRRFWARADVRISSSCLCQPGAKVTKR